MVTYSLEFVTYDSILCPRPLDLQFLCLVLSLSLSLSLLLKIFVPVSFLLVLSPSYSTPNSVSKSSNLRNRVELPMSEFMLLYDQLFFFFLAKLIGNIY
jgi:hypothetical protein